MRVKVIKNIYRVEVTTIKYIKATDPKEAVRIFSYGKTVGRNHRIYRQLDKDEKCERVFEASDRPNVRFKLEV